MDPLLKIPRLAAVIALSAASCFAAGPALQASPPPGQTVPGAPAAPAPQGLPRVCLDVQTGDPVTQDFSDRLKQMIDASGALSLASKTDSCDLQLHVPGNLLRFETTVGIMVSAVVVVTSSTGQYLSTSITACRANDLKPCAARAVNIAKLALLMISRGGPAGDSG